MPRLTLLCIAFLASVGLAQYAAISSTAGSGSCSATNKCPASAPCCSEFGFCGTGHFCLGGCNPLYSSAPGACAPQPSCVSGKLTFTNASRIVNGTKFNNDATAADWTLDSGAALTTTAGELVLPLTQTGPTAGGSRISSTRAVLYGNIVARIKSSQYAGVVTAFITMSGVKDEIDWEFPGSHTTVGQTNYYYEGLVANYTHGGTANISNSFANYHDYGLNWTPSQLTWSVDNVVVRTLTKASTLDNSTGIYNYPSSPSRVQLSIWPAGIAAQPIGTQTWAGGLINWTTTDYTQTGYYYALIESVSITCDSASIAGASYTYGANDSTGGPAVIVGNAATQIYSQAATGLDMTAGKTTTSSSNATFGLINGAGSMVALGTGALKSLLVAGTVMAGVGLLI